MKNTLFSILLLLFSQLTSAQEYLMTFSSSGDSVAIDSVKAINKSSGLSIVFPGWEPLILSETAGIDNYTEVKEMLIFPNPFDQDATIQINLKQDQNVRISVLNVLGKLVLREVIFAGAGQASFRLSLSSPGVYYAFVHADGQVQNCKLVCLHAENQLNQVDYSGSGNLSSSSANKTRPLGDNRYVLDFHPGDLMHYIAYSGDYSTVIADYPVDSKNYSVEFYACSDGRISYPVTRIGDQVWMAKNLAYLPWVKNPTGELSSNPSYYVYGYHGSSRSTAIQTKNYQTYGVLYNWSAAKSDCPVGWHLPSKSEWDELFDYLGSYGAFKVMDNSAGLWTYRNSHMTDEVGFGALPGGELYPFMPYEYNFGHYPDFRRRDTVANFWTRTQTELTVKEGLSPYFLRLHNFTSDGLNYYFEHEYYSSHYLVPSVSTATSGYSVRCILGKSPTPPKVELTGISELTPQSFIINGKIVSDGGVTITEVGFCFSEEQGVTIDDRVYDQEPQEDIISYKIENLKPNSSYYVNIYARNEEGIGYGNELEVTTPEGWPAVKTDYIVQITDQAALASGTVLNTGGKAIIEAGFCWSEDPDPTLENHFVTSRLTDSTFQSSIEQLTPSNRYYLRAYARNSEGTSFGENLVMKTAAGSFNYMGDDYGYVTIGNQIWMNQNLRYLPEVSPPEDLSEEDAKYYVYGYESTEIAQAKLEENYIKYGALYNWPAVMQDEPPSETSPSGVRGICPPGWHLPSEAEYDELLNFTGSSGNGYRSDCDWDESDPGTGNNQNGFNAFPGGIKQFGFQGIHQSAYFWTASENIDEVPLYFMVSSFSWISDPWHGGSDALSVRCIKNEGLTKPRAILSAPRIASIGVDVLFDASASYDPDSPEEELSCRWDWDADGSWDTDYEDELQTTHAFSEQGLYTISVEVRDQDNAINQTEVILTIGAGQFEDARDNNQYVYVTIGEQTWMAENLKYLPEVFLIDEISETDPRYYVPVYSGDDLNQARQDPYYQKYGAFYNYPAAESACPDGWHLPSDSEWKILERFLGMSVNNSNMSLWRSEGSVGRKLRTTYGWDFNQNGTNTSLLTILPTPFDSASEWKFGYESTYMTSSFNSQGEIYHRMVRYNEEGVYRYVYPTGWATSVRCVKD